MIFERHVVEGVERQVDEQADPAVQHPVGLREGETPLGFVANDYGLAIWGTSMSGTWRLRMASRVF